MRGLLKLKIQNNPAFLIIRQGYFGFSEKIAEVDYFCR